METSVMAAKVCYIYCHLTVTTRDCEFKKREKVKYKKQKKEKILHPSS